MSRHSTYLGECDVWYVYSIVALVVVCNVQCSLCPNSLHFTLNQQAFFCASIVRPHIVRWVSIRHLSVQLIWMNGHNDRLIVCGSGATRMPPRTFVNTVSRMRIAKLKRSIRAKRHSRINKSCRNWWRGRVHLRIVVTEQYYYKTPWNSWTRVLRLRLPHPLLLLQQPLLQPLPFPKPFPRVNYPTPRANW